MARPISEGDDSDTSPTVGDGDSGATTPAATPASGSKLGAIVTGTNYTFTADQIASAGGPWSAFTLRVTPLNAKGAGTAAEAQLTVTPPSGDVIDGGGTGG